MSTVQHPIIVIAGPTAGGKTALSLDLAEQLPGGGGEIVGADSMQVYRGMDIGTAKPTEAERARVPHHLIDMVDPDEPFTVDDWRQRAEETIEDVRRRGKWPIVVGGTNLYVKVLLFGIFDGPAADSEFRAALDSVASPELHGRLAAVDAEGARRIHPNDRKRIIRSLEVHHLTGQPLSELQRQWNAESEPRRDGLVIGLEWSTDAINRRINARVRLMMEQGLLEEVRSLYESGRLGPQAREALGYKQILEHLAGDRTLDEAVEQIKIETRRFARRQRTWFKHFRMLPCARWLAADDAMPQNLLQQALKLCTEHPLTS